MTFNDIAKDWVEAGCKLVDDNKDNPKMYAYGVKRALNTMLENFADVPVVEWHSFPKEKPNEDGDYLVTIQWDIPKGEPYRVVGNASWMGFGWDMSDTEILAWSDLPRPYEEDSDDK